MTKKVIWIINQTAGKPDSGWGERHFFLAQYWIKAGYEVKIISGSYNHLFMHQPKVSKKMFTVEAVAEGITFCWVKIPKYDGGSVFKLWSMLVFAFKILFLSTSDLGKPHIVIVSSMPLFSIVPGWFLKQKHKASKLLFEVRDLWPLTPIHLSGYAKYHPMILMMSWFEKFGYKKADAIVSLLPNAHLYIDNISKQPEKFNWIPNGIDENLLPREPLVDGILDLIPKNKFILGYAGTLGMANAMEFFIAAAKELKENENIHFVCVGDGYLKDGFINETKNLKNITFIPKIKKAQVQHLLQFFNVCYVGRYANTLYRYGVSYNKYFDYMLAKKPILESSECIGSPAEKAGCAVMVEPESSKAIVQGILKLYSMPQQEIEKMGENGYHYVLKYHNFDFLSQLYLKLF
jgi:glycosyltransferase involved in cell wall biosynthesis